MNSVSIILPTYNSAKTLQECLDSIKNQNFPPESLELIVVDGGSADESIEIARKYTDRVLYNMDKVEEKGRAIGICESHNEIVGFIDADNILDSPEFLQRMLEPFNDPEIHSSQPLYYSHRPQDPLLVRYCGLIGADDPIAVYLGYFDHFCYFKGQGIGVSIPQEDFGSYLKLDISNLLEVGMVPIGANGFFIRRHLLKAKEYSFLIHSDLVYDLVKTGSSKFAQVNIGITHKHADNISEFFQKKVRRIERFFTNQTPRSWNPTWGLSKVFIVGMRVILLFPLVIDALKGYRSAPDPGWFYHPIISWLVLIAYGVGLLKAKLPRRILI